MIETLPTEDVSPHKREMCRMCGPFVRCGYCGNNCCNGGTEELPDGSKCGCEEAYNVQKKFYEQCD